MIEVTWWCPGRIERRWRRRYTPDQIGRARTLQRMILRRRRACNVNYVRRFHSDQVVNYPATEAWLRGVTLSGEPFEMQGTRLTGSTFEWQLPEMIYRAAVWIAADVDGLGVQTVKLLGDLVCTEGSMLTVPDAQITVRE